MGSRPSSSSTEETKQSEAKEDMIEMKEGEKVVAQEEHKEDTMAASEEAPPAVEEPKVIKAQVGKLQSIK